MKMQTGTSTGYRSYAIASLVVLAILGWGWALQQRFAKPQAGETLENGIRRSSASATRGATRPAVGGGIAGLLSTPRSARLFKDLDDIATAASSGVVNEKLIKACRETLGDSDFRRRGRDFALLLELMRPEDAAALHQTFLSLHEEGRGFAREYEDFAVRWGEVDGAGALQGLTSEKPLRLTSYDLRSIIRGWSGVDPDAARAWVRDHPEIAMPRGAESAAIKGWLCKEPAAATAYLTSPDAAPAVVMEAVEFGANDLLYGVGIDGSVDWLVSLPDQGMLGAAASRAWNHTSDQYNELPYATAARVWGKVGGEPWMTFGQFANFSAKVGRARVNAAGEAGFLTALAEAWPADGAAAQFKRWQQQEPERVGQWLANAPDNDFVRRIRAVVTDGQLDSPE